MGLFSKKDACPVCGGEVKGLFLTKIAGKQTLCGDCSKQISMQKELLEKATPDTIKRHLEDRRKNAELFTDAHWDVKSSFLGLECGADAEKKLLYISYSKMHNEKNPTVFSFDQLTGYQLYRLKKLVDDDQTPGPTDLESALSTAANMARVLNLVAGKGGGGSQDYFILKVTTTDPWWPAIELKIEFLNSQLHGVGGRGAEAERLFHTIKCAVRKEPMALA